jgi:hypothetical protein
MKHLCGALLCVLWLQTAHAQDYNFWHTLAEVGFTTKKDKNGHTIEKPVFSKHLKSWDGEKIRIKGYIIPVSEVGDQEKFILSSLPFNVCYFCGAAGPETIIEVETMESISFSSKAVWMEGVLQLNDGDPDHHMYRLLSAKIIPPPSSSAGNSKNFVR